MLKTTQILLLVAALLVVSQACTVPGISTSDSNSVNTVIAQTIVAALTQTSQPIMPIIPITGLESPTFTFTPDLPTFTPTETLTPTPVFTSTPLIPQISVSVPTNCRVGPGKVYDRVGALLIGEIAEVVGRNPIGNYWYIRNPDQSNGFCWLWGEYATLTGNTSVLPVYTPPPTPTPTPNFAAFYAGKDTCTGWWVDIELENIGGLSFESISITVRDTVTDSIVSMYADSFTDINGCITSNTKEALPPGATRIVSTPAFTYDPTGHELRATITLCSSPGQNGTCITQVIHFTP
ncbi:MAG TPA: SH3 domain-containing protein [Anaerolineales bacterium]